MWKDIVILFREYMGTGLIVIWFVVSLIYLWINEKRKDLRTWPTGELKLHPSTRKDPTACPWPELLPCYFLAMLNQRLV